MQTAIILQIRMKRLVRENLLLEAVYFVQERLLLEMVHQFVQERLLLEMALQFAQERQPPAMERRPAREEAVPVLRRQGLSDRQRRKARLDPDLEM